MTEQKENIVQLAPYLEADKDKVIELFLLANEALTQNNVEMYIAFHLQALSLAKSIKRRQ
ncbi:hypothetical protein [Paraglaciecola sp. MB-3u-78]|jgi:hypothetical protein|uniref:hypothetical protein n=1 Tax=Paraglaciecola sp. MB-3u-78 TaxID=2058332 RepID=UPI000C3468A9|nr:hypothetical protein [Paraglaciecola sp. MB-3u-78]PKG97855.1 hypothetical protein CXF95_15585 [Paraglaciecola sp. MB-3u-78]